MIIRHQTVSAYLTQPSIAQPGHTRWNGFRTNLIEIKRDNPHIVGRTIAALVIWTAGAIAIQGFGYVHETTASHQLNVAGLNLASTAQTPNGTVSKTSSLTTAVHAQILPSGPTGQLLPPGTMAPFRTYANSYATGQCTWYVASRRQIPGGWGNASAWYYHAISAGWSVGTTPAVAAIAWTPSGYYGHVALVEQVSADGSEIYISEMNSRGIGVIDSRWVSAKQFKYIY